MNMFYTSLCFCKNLKKKKKSFLLCNILLERSDCLVNDQQRQTQHIKDRGRNKHCCCESVKMTTKLPPNEWNCSWPVYSTAGVWKRPGPATHCGRYSGPRRRWRGRLWSCWNWTTLKTEATSVVSPTTSLLSSAWPCDSILWREFSRAGLEVIWISADTKRAWTIRRRGRKPVERGEPSESRRRGLDTSQRNISYPSSLPASFCRSRGTFSTASSRFPSRHSGTRR